MVVIPAMAAAVAAPLLTLGSSWLERRLLLRALSVLVLLSNVVGGHRRRVRSDARRPSDSKIAIVSGGIFIATVAALPVAALIGNLTS
jgi:predicted MFS family arabinose efflux permease